MEIEFNAGDPAEVRSRVQVILSKENLTLPQDEIDEIISEAAGSWRHIIPIARMLAIKNTSSLTPPTLKTVK